MTNKGQDELCAIGGGYNDSNAACRIIICNQFSPDIMPTLENTHTPPFSQVIGPGH